MRRMLVFMLMFTLVLQTVSLTVDTGKAYAEDCPVWEYDEDGSTILIDSELELSCIREKLDGDYKLTADIDLSGYDYDGDGGGWMPIGDFTGTLDGNGHAIRNMTINRSSSFVGLFGRITGANAELNNIRLLDVNVVGGSGVSGGALVGNVVNGKIENSYATGSVNTLSNAGGLVGVNAGGKIQNSYAVVNVGSWDIVGGLVGTNAGTIQNSYAAGNVTGRMDIGGLVGYNNSGTIKNSYSVGHVTGNSSFGGLVGRLDSGAATNSVWNTETSGQTASAGGTGVKGKTTEEMKDPNTFSSWSSADWGFRDGETYPYLRAFHMGIGVDRLATTTYNLHPGQDALSVTGSVYHEASGEPIAIKYVIRDSSNDVVTEAAHLTTGGNGALSINRRFSLAGWSNGDYTVTITAADTRNTVVGAMLAFKVDSSAASQPSVNFEPNGNETWAQSASASVTVSDSGGGVDEDELQYAWTTDTATPFSGWTSFTETDGQILSKDGVDGDWYLHIRAQDNSDNPANVVSNRFRLDNTVPTFTITQIPGSSDPTSGPVTVNVAFDGTGSPIAETKWADGERLTEDFASEGTVYTGGSFRVVKNGTYTVYAKDAAGNEAVEEIEITNIVATEPDDSESGWSIWPAPSSEPTIVEAPDGGIIVRIDPSGIVKETREDGTVIEKVVLTDEMIDKALEALEKADKPHVTIEIDDSEQAVQVQFPASSLGMAIASYPDAVFEVMLNGSSFQLQINVLNLNELAERLGVDPQQMTVNVVIEQVAGREKERLEQIAGKQGLKLIGQAVEYQVTVSAGGRTVEIRDFGGTYMVRAIVLDGDLSNKNVTAVLYDPDKGTLSFVPAVMAKRNDARREMSMRVPHNSIYAVMEAGNPSFADLNGHWAKHDVELLASKLIVYGESDTRFAPDDTITRAEFTALLVRALGIRLEGKIESTAFEDVSKEDWYAPVIAAGVNAGLVDGISEDRFAPNSEMTREQMAVMIANALSVAGKSAMDAGRASIILEKFADRSDISPWARSAVAQSVAAGIIHGVTERTMAPSEHATRAQAAVMLGRFLRAVEFVD